MRRLLLFLLVSVSFHLLILVPFFLFQDRLPLPGGTGVSVEIVPAGEDHFPAPSQNRSFDRLLGPAIADLRSRPAQDQRPLLSGAARASSKQPGSGPSGSDSLLAEIRSRIERVKRYPIFARKSGVEGRALVRFQINRSGEPDGILLKTSSGSGILDQEAVETVRRAAPYPVYQDPLEIWIRFELKQ